MSAPSVQINKTDGGTGVVRPSDVGVPAIISCATGSTPNQASLYLDTGIVASDWVDGKLVECASYVMPECGHPALLVKGSQSVAGAYGAVTFTGTGTSVPTGDGTSKPVDDYNVLIIVKNGGTVGVTGITYTYSFDGGQTTSAITALGTANNIVLPDSGVKIDLAAGTLVAGDKIAVPCTSPANSNADLVNALEALRVTDTPFEGILVDQPADATTVANLDTWITGQELVGKFKFAVCTARARHTDGSETEAQYKTFLQGVFGATSSINVIVCADVGDVSSPVPNRGTSAAILPRAVGWALMARLMKISLGTDPAFAELGPVSQFQISDSRGNPNHHDEQKYPGLDDLRLCTLTTVPGKIGTFITNAPVLSTPGSDYVFAQHIRTINRACEIGFAILSGQLSRGVDKDPKVGPNGARYIAEGDALRIEALANSAIKAELAGQVSDIRFVLSRTDDISSNQGATVNASIQSVALAYIKKFKVTAGFVKSITQ